MTIAENVAEPLIVHKKFSSVSDARKYVGDLLEMVQLPRAYMNRFPHELSGGPAPARLLGTRRWR